MIAKYLASMFLVALALLPATSPAYDWITVEPSQWPAAPTGKSFTKEVIYPENGKMKLEVWRQEIAGRPILFLRGSAAAGTPLFCGGDLAIQQGGKKFSVTLRQKGAAFYDQYCTKPTQPVVLLFESSSDGFDDKAAFRLTTNEYYGFADYLDIEAYSAAGASTTTGATGATGATGTTGTTGSTVPASGSSDADKIFNWAEKTYPKLFPTTQPTQTLMAYTYRYYKETGIYLAVSNGRVVVHGGGFNMLDVGPVKDFLALAAASSSSASGAIPVGNYVCYSGVSWGSWQRMGNVEILSASTFRNGDSTPYPYSYDASTGKVSLQGGMFTGMAAEYSNKDNKPQIHILYKTAELLHALDYWCDLQK